MPTADMPAPSQIAAPTPARRKTRWPKCPPPRCSEGGLARPTPAVAPATESSTPNLIDQAKQLRQRGDMPSALARLREAQGLEPDNPQIIAEIALTYEAMQVSDKAFEQWQRLFGMGESIGALYYLADSRLHTAPASSGTAPGGAAPTTPGTDAATGSALSALQETTVLKITDLHLDEVPDPDAEKKLVLRIVVKDRPGSAIDPNKVRILTYFYDLIDGKDVVLTDAQTDYNWMTPPPINWAGDKSEVLETTYLRAKGASASATPTASTAPAATPRASRRGRGGQRAGRGRRHARPRCADGTGARLPRLRGPALLRPPVAGRAGGPRPFAATISAAADAAVRVG